MYKFYYDESEHSRKLTLETVNDDGFYDGFVAVIVGWDESDEADIERRYERFECMHSDRKSNGEIKSTTVKPKQLAHGFASLGKANLSLIGDFLSLFDEKVRVYLCYESKTEYVAEQLFKDYGNTGGIDADLMRYSIVKSIVQYQPKSVVNAMYDDPSSLVDRLREFYYERIRQGIENIQLKRKEVDQYGQILMLLEGARRVETLDWDYSEPFVGFLKYLTEVGISDYSLVIDREDKTEDAARRLGIERSSGGDSKDYFGLRMADMLAGVVCKLMKALHKELRYHHEGEFVQRRLVGETWFQLDDRRLGLYKKLDDIAIRTNNARYKVYAGSYSDDLVMLIALLTLMRGLGSAAELRSVARECPERLNTIACEMLGDHYRRVMDKSDNEIRVGSVPIISEARAMLLPEGQKTVNVLSVGYDSLGIPLILIDEGEMAVCYRLPDDLREWAYTLAGIAGSDLNVLPSIVLFTTRRGKHYADIL